MMSKRKKAALGAAELATVAFCLALFVPLGGSASAPSLPSAADWAHFGVTIGPARAASAILPQTAQAAAAQAIGGSVLNSQYAHCQVPAGAKPIDQDCYLELMDPTEAIAGQTVTWFVVMVDATTSKPIAWFSDGPSGGTPPILPAPPTTG